MPVWVVGSDVSFGSGGQAGTNAMSQSMGSFIKDLQNADRELQEFGQGLDRLEHASIGYANKLQELTTHVGSAVAHMSGFASLLRHLGAIIGGLSIANTFVQGTRYHGQMQEMAPSLGGFSSDDFDNFRRIQTDILNKFPTTIDKMTEFGKSFMDAGLNVHNTNKNLSQMMELGVKAQEIIGLDANATSQWVRELTDLGETQDKIASSFDRFYQNLNQNNLSMREGVKIVRESETAWRSYGGFLGLTLTDMRSRMIEAHSQFKSLNIEPEKGLSQMSSMAGDPMKMAKTAGFMAAMGVGSFDSNFKMLLFEPAKAQAWEAFAGLKNLNLMFPDLVGKGKDELMGVDSSRLAGYMNVLSPIAQAAGMDSSLMSQYLSSYTKSGGSLNDPEAFQRFLTTKRQTGPTGRTFNQMADSIAESGIGIGSRGERLAQVEGINAFQTIYRSGEGKAALDLYNHGLEQVTDSLFKFDHILQVVGVTIGAIAMGAGISWVGSKWTKAGGLGGVISSLFGKGRSDGGISGGGAGDLLGSVLGAGALGTCGNPIHVLSHGMCKNPLSALPSITGGAGGAAGKVGWLPALGAVGASAATGIVAGLGVAAGAMGIQTATNEISERRRFVDGINRLNRERAAKGMSPIIPTGDDAFEYHGPRSVVHPQTAAPNHSTNSGWLSSMFEGSVGSVAPGYRTRYQPGDIFVRKGIWQRPGTAAYGAWQMDSGMGTPQKFVSWLEKHHPDMFARLNPFVGSIGNHKGAFAQAWKGLAKEDGHDFVNAQKEYLMGGYLGGMLKKFPGIAKSDVLKEVAFSSAIQHGVGGAESVFNKAGYGKVSPEQFLHNVYSERRKLMSGGRYDREESMAMRALLSEQNKHLQQMNERLANVEKHTQQSAQEHKATADRALANRAKSKIDPART